MGEHPLNDIAVLFNHLDFGRMSRRVAKSFPAERFLRLLGLLHESADFRGLLACRLNPRFPVICGQGTAEGRGSEQTCRISSIRKGPDCCGQVTGSCFRFVATARPPRSLVHLKNALSAAPRHRLVRLFLVVGYIKVSRWFRRLRHLAEISLGGSQSFAKLSMFSSIKSQRSIASACRVRAQ